MIFTLNAKDNIIFPIMKSTFKLSEVAMYRNIEMMYEELLARLRKKGVAYESLKGALIPNQDKDKFETCFVFDSFKIKDNYYGRQIFSKLIPLMDKKSTYSILCGDYIDTSKKNNSQQTLDKWLRKVLTVVNTTDFKHSSQYYLVYFNRLTRGQRQVFIDGLSNEEWFVGYTDVTHQSGFKSYISRILAHSYVKQGRNIIASHPADCLDAENINMRDYPFEENQFNFISINEESYLPFLSYKIESVLLDKEDVMFSLNALSPKVVRLNRIKVIVESNKWNDYLFKDENPKREIMHALGYSIKEKRRFQREIKKKIASNYIYNLEIDRTHNILKFNVCTEHKTIHNRYRRTMVSLEYIPKRRRLRLITIT